MSSARKRAYKHKAYAEIYDLKQRLMMLTYHYGCMDAMNQALAKAGDEARAERDRLRAALEAMTSMMESGDEHGLDSAWYKQAKAALTQAKTPCDVNEP